VDADERLVLDLRAAVLAEQPKSPIRDSGALGSPGSVTRACTPERSCRFESAGAAEASLVVDDALRAAPPSPEPADAHRTSAAR
jgi:hypothetical protein